MTRKDLTLADVNSTYVSKTGNVSEDINGIKTFLSVPVCATNASSDSQLTNKAFTDLTYQPISLMSNYLRTSAASLTYLTQANASLIYQTIEGMSAYLTTSAASSTYLTISNAITTYVGLGSANTFTSTNQFNQPIKIQSTSDR